VGSYRIVRHLGGGGMGSVYVGYDERLQRHVALKAIRAERRLDSEARERFLREARVLSSLDHPNICRIYDYLQSEEGDYLVLELIEGEDLGQAFPQLTRAAKLPIAEQIARALATAHAAGIVHRDLKPENVMLTPSGEIKVLDFGLARIHAPTREPDAPLEPDGTNETPSLTESGVPRSIWLTQRTNVVAGTPGFMSPEQARGEPVSAASDLYSFGLLLQYAFTGNRPYEDGLNVRDLLERARDGRSLPVAGLDRDLTRLIERLKSIEAADRPTAGEAAQRLRWIREKPRRRLRRLVVAAMIAIAAFAGIKYAVDLGNERSQAIAARNDAEDLLTFMLGDLRDGLAPVGRLDVLDSVGDKALEYFSRLPERDLGDDDLYRRAQALRLIGEVKLAQGSMPAAAEAFAESLALATDVVARHPEHPEWLADLGASHFYIGQIRMQRGDLDGALEQFDFYRDIADRLVELDGEKPQWQLERAYAHANRGAVFERMGNLGAAMEETERSIAIKRRLVASEPANADWNRSLANSLSWLATSQWKSGDKDSARRTFNEELSVREGLVEADPRRADDRFHLSTCHSLLGELLLEQAQCTEALHHSREMTRLAQLLVQHDPANANWQRELAVSHRLLSQVQLCLGRSDAALAALQTGHGILEELIEREPGNAEWRLQLATVKNGMVAVALDQERWNDAAAEARAAIAVLAPVMEVSPVPPMVRLRVARLHLDRGEALQHLADRVAAHEAWNRALVAIEPAVRESDLLKAKSVMAIALLQLGRIDEAEPIVRQLEGTAVWGTDLEKLAREKGIVSKDT
jgi:serine/threonine-protein kinase